MPTRSIEALSGVLYDIVTDANKSKKYNSGIKAMKSRASEFRSEVQMMLAGLAVVPECRAMVNDRLSEYWGSGSYYLPTYGFASGEVIIGGGLHAAIYSAARVAAGFPRPYVIEAGRVGGTFAVSDRPAFYLNSLNRPGLLGGPGRDQSLNYLPGADIQPSDISLAEYQTNADLAFVIRCTLAQYASVIGGRVTDISSVNSEGGDITLEDGREFRAGRIIDARGLGAANVPDGKLSDRVMTFPELLARADTTFPLRGMGRVAVIGGGDSGRVAVETLLGIGPAAGMSTAALDYVSSIDFYGRSLPQYCDDWRRTQRGRYGRIGAYLPRFDNPRLTRLTVRQERADIAVSTDSVIVNGRTYDRAVYATGYKLSNLGSSYGRYDWSPYQCNGITVGKRCDYGEFYKVGPASDLPFTGAEQNDPNVTSLPANRVSVFRYANRTAAMATNLPAPGAML